MNKLPSEFQIGDHASVFGQVGKIVGVHFSEVKVAYDVELDIGGLALENVDSTFVEKAEIEIASGGA